VRPLTPPPSPLVVGIAYRNEKRPAAVDEFIAAAKQK